MCGMTCSCEQICYMIYALWKFMFGSLSKIPMLWYKLDAWNQQAWATSIKQQKPAPRIEVCLKTLSGCDKVQSACFSTCFVLDNGHWRTWPTCWSATRSMARTRSGQMAIIWHNWKLEEILPQHWEFCWLFARPHIVLPCPLIFFYMQGSETLLLS